MLNLIRALYSNSLNGLKINYSINAMYNKSSDHWHLLYRECVYKRDSSLYLDGHLVFSLYETILHLTWKSQKLHKGESVIKAHVNDQEWIIGDLSLGHAINTDISRAFKGVRPSALIFHELNQNCFFFIFIISNRIQFNWNIIGGLKRISFLQKSTLCLIMIWRKLDTVETNCIFFLLQTKIKIKN